MGKIEKFNCEGLCQQQYCDQKYTHVLQFELEGFVFNLMLCEKHHDAMNKILELRRTNVPIVC